MVDKIINCSITHTDAEVLKEYGYINNGKEYHVGIDLKADNIFSPFKGVVIQADKYENYYFIVLQYSEHISLRFTHLNSLEVREGSLVEYNQLIGTAENFVHFEYLTTEVNNPNFTVKLPSGYTLWKHDPRLILERNIIFDQSDIPSEEIFIWGDTLAELSNNRGLE